jgi:[CysO sulfur-carrier protein]-S-L-cysteine hydrolase
VSTSFRLLVPRPLYDDMIAQAKAELPKECCGLFAGKIVTTDTGDAVAQVRRRYPLVNKASEATTEYHCEDLFAAMVDMREQEYDLLAIYHSHPAAAPVPSQKDRERNFYGPDVLHLIVSLAKTMPEVLAWRLWPVSHEAAAWEVVEQKSI